MPMALQRVVALRWGGEKITLFLAKTYFNFDFMISGIGLRITECMH